MRKLRISINAFFLIIITFVVNSECCDKAIDVQETRGARLKWEVKLPLKPPKKCIFSALGTDNCDVEVSCKVDIPKSDDCEDDFVKITDGVYGEKLLCGKSEGTFMPSEGLKHLFVVLETSGKTGSVACQAKCAKTGKRLEKNKKTKIENRCGKVKQLKHEYESRHLIYYARNIERMLTLIVQNFDFIACGFQNKDDRIVGGEDAKMNEFPWVAAIVFPGTRSPTCGASIINDRYVLTAAHCFWFDDKQPTDIEILFHAHTLDMTKKINARDVALGKDGSIQSSGYNLAKKTDADEKSKRYQVVQIINHPLFNEYYDYDFALLRLHKKIDLSAADAPTPICLPPASTWDSLMSSWKGKLLTVAGWGLSAENAGGSTRVLQKLDVPFIEWPTCQKKVPPDILTRRMLCAGFEGGKKDACTGDSGGPLFYKIPSTNQFWQLGIVSWGEGCARKGKPGMYSRVTEMVQWIHFHSAEGDAKWCTGPKPIE